jgi:hypothetical protein
VLIKLQERTVRWQTDALSLVQHEAVERTRKAAPERYVAARKWSDGASPATDGFVVNAEGEGETE